VHFVKGEPDDDELAAVVLALALVSRRATVEQLRSRWRASLAARSPNATRDRQRNRWRSGV
jgi:Arc/MetJ family transcription regulator